VYNSFLYLAQLIFFCRLLSIFILCNEVYKINTLCNPNKSTLKPSITVINNTFVLFQLLQVLLWVAGVCGFLQMSLPEQVNPPLIYINKTNTSPQNVTQLFCCHIVYPFLLNLMLLLLK